MVWVEMKLYKKKTLARMSIRAEHPRFILCLTR